MRLTVAKGSSRSPTRRCRSIPSSARTSRRITADGDLVMAHSLIKFSPEDRGTAVVDILRFEDGKIVEQWDVRQPVPEATAIGNPFTSPDRS
jgi:predicted SnoaL-like aldol condensation-catalyzing enzyme